jgi:iron complex transport system substrate-binding protein
VGWRIAVAVTLVLAEGVHGFTVRDMREQEIVLARPPERIVSLVPSATEDIFAVGGEDRLVGVTNFCDWPPAARGKPRVGGMVAPNLEAIVALRPDLVVATDEGNSQFTFDQLARLGVPVYVVRARRLQEAIEVMARMGELTGRSTAVGPLVDRLRARVGRVVEAVRPFRRQRVLYVLWPDPIIVPGREGLVTELVRLAGGVSVTEDSSGAYPRLGLEAVVAFNPDVVVLARHGGDQTPVLRATWDRLAALPAIRAGRVHSVDGSLMHRYGPRVVDGLETLARIVHPEARF